MRFLANGPSIPDELLVARDQGRVIFFCGAGVSQAKAGLPDFFGLAKKVIEELGVSDSNPVHKLIKEARKIENRTGVSGLISADKIFAMLERDFESRDIQEAVAKALKPKTKVDCSAHKILLDLATAQDGQIRLVTTNFDLLFEKAYQQKISCFKPPKLPDPLDYEGLVGITHLHGHVTSDYTGAAGDNFILSSAEFGQAYLSEGWATEFVKTILEKYFVVFIGYRADDPPVQYLLEALGRHSGILDGILCASIRHCKRS